MNFKTRLENGKLRVEDIMETVTREVTKPDGTVDQRQIERPNPKKINVISRLYNVYTGEEDGEESQVFDIDDLRVQKQALSNAITEIDDKIAVFKSAQKI